MKLGIVEGMKSLEEHRGQIEEMQMLFEQTKKSKGELEEVERM